MLAYNDLVALGLPHRFAARGVAVPAAISVLGFDDIPVAATVHPAPTTVALPQGQAGQSGVDLLLAPLQKQEGQAVRRELPTQLMVRGSTGPAR